MAVNQDYLTFVEDQLSEFGEFQIKRMFGGIGIFKEGLMMGMIGGEVLRLKVDEHNQAEYEAKGMKPYQPNKNKKGMPYWEVPVDVLEDKTELAKWATKSYEAALRAKK
jgi:DNA transformation protein